MAGNEKKLKLKCGVWGKIQFYFSIIKMACVYKLLNDLFNSRESSGAEKFCKNENNESC